MAMVAQFWSLNGLATELGRDRRALGRALEGVEPDKGEGRSARWLMRTAVAALHDKGGELDQGAEKARLTKEQADRVEMENQRMRGELVAVADVEVARISELVRARSKLLGIPSGTAAKILATTDMAEAESILRAAIVEALQELSGVSDDGYFEGNDGESPQDLDPPA